MKELSLQELKQIELDILKVFHSFCVENGIRYFLSHGTLLGAIRYKHFIPWDDDVDVLVPREDYDKLLSLYKDDERYRLFCFEKDQNYRYPYAKLCDMTTRKVEFDYDNGLELGVDMDIFPLDAWDDDLEKAKKEEKRLSRDRFRLGLTKLKKPDSLNPVKRFVKGIVMGYCKLFGSKHYIRKIMAESNKESQKGNVYLGNKAWCVYGQKDIMPAKVFAESVDIEFEGAMFPAPKDYDTYLTCLYGDYLPEPPKEKQKTHHMFKAYRR